MTSYLSDNKLASILPNAIFLLDKSCHILWWNPAAQELFDLDEETHLKRNINKVIESISSRDLQNGLEAETEVDMPNGSKLMIAYDIIAYSDQHYLLIARNITQLHQLENMRSDFVANVSHEMRTPLTVVLGYLETLLEEKTGDIEPWQNVFSQMYQQSNRMKRLVQNLLLLSRLETAIPLNLQTVSVAPLLHSICDDAQALSGVRKHNIITDIDETLDLQGHEEELRSAFSNIIYNAINYTPDEGTITVRWYKHENSAVFEVIDSGMGIPEDLIPRITERFFRVDKARSRESGGTGLGLAIVKHVLLRHDGQLKISSELEKGSIFTCVFPLDS